MCFAKRIRFAEYTWRTAYPNLLNLIALVGLSLMLAGCFTDAATRLAGDIEDAADRVGSQEGSTFRLQHQTPSKRGQCEGPYTIQLDEVGALIIWCYGSDGSVVSSHSTTSHSASVGTARTIIVEKVAGSSLEIVLTRLSGRVVIVEAM